MVVRDSCINESKLPLLGTAWDNQVFIFLFWIILDPHVKSCHAGMTHRFRSCLTVTSASDTQQPAGSPGKRLLAGNGMQVMFVKSSRP